MNLPFQIGLFNIVILLFLAALKMFKDFSINPYTCRVCTDTPPHTPAFPKYFLNEPVSFEKYAIISPKIDEICNKLSNSKFFCE